MISAAHITKPQKVPALQNGDHLTVKEFESRYLKMPQVKKAELIEGVVYMPSPVRFRRHSKPHCDLNGWLFTYCIGIPEIEEGDNSTLRLRVGENEPQPDSCLRIIEECGGQSRIDDEDYIVGAPEWIGEISASSKSIDLHEKMLSYEKNGVLEYVVWRVEDKEIDWFVLKRGKFQRLAMTKDGLYKSKAFPGLWLDPDAMIAGDMAKVIEVVQKGISSPEHRRFVEKLRSKKK
jgi:hypothetical protein